MHFRRKRWNPAAWGAGGPSDEKRMKLPIRIAGFVSICAAVALSQSSVDLTHFDAASVKASPAGSTGGGFIPSPGRLTIRNSTLMTLIANAYRLASFQVASGPAWLDSDRFDIVAKADGKATTLQMLPMLQALLAERFQLRVHREIREIPGFWLVVAKKGPKFKPAPGGDGSSQGFNVEQGKLMGYKVSMESLAVHLGLLLHVPLTDNTGLKGEFDLKLEWGPDQYALTAPEAVAPEELEKLPLQNALEEQLGLKLQVHSVPLPVLVVDHAERPSAN